MKDFYESYLKELKKSLDSLIIEDLEEVTLALKEAYDKDRQIFIFGNVLTAWSNDLTFEECFKEQLINLLQEGDLVIAFSASGNSRNVLKAVEYAKSKGATTIGFSGFEGGGLAKIAHKSIVVKSNNMERIEDIHLILEHMLKSCLKQIIL
jgi:D-sedoheptulose 7-phosphate isomerase